jgi:hypothetical protein
MSGEEEFDGLLMNIAERKRGIEVHPPSSAPACLSPAALHHQGQSASLPCGLVRSPLREKTAGSALTPPRVNLPRSPCSTPFSVS